jgi:hypothetical protein
VCVRWCCRSDFTFDADEHGTHSHHLADRAAQFDHAPGV